MDNIGFFEALNADPRPTFVIDLSSVEQQGHVQPCFSNDSFRNRHDLFKLILDLTPESSALRDWITGPSRRSQPTIALNHILTHRGPQNTTWQSHLVRNRWKIIHMTYDNASQTSCVPPTPPEDMLLFCDAQTEITSRASENVSSKRFLLITTLGLTEQAIATITGLDSLIDLISEFDWASSGVGPIESWPDELLQVIMISLLHPSPHCMFLGPDHQLFYNVGYAAFCGARHPSILGKPLFEAWGEARELNYSILSHVDKTGGPFLMNDFEMSIDRNGFLEEVFMQWVTLPMRGSIRGYLCAATEETGMRISARRNKTLSDLTKACQNLRNMKSLWNTLLEHLATNPKDYPTGCLYLKSLTPGTYHLEGVIDGSEACDGLPAEFNLNTSTDGFAGVLKEAENLFNPMHLLHEDGTMPPRLSEIATTRGFKDFCTRAVVCPIRRSNDSELLGFLILGLNTRKVFDQGCADFILYVVMRTISDLATRTTLAQEEDRKAKEAAEQSATQHQTLRQALASSTSQTTYMSSKLDRLLKIMEMSDVGIFEISPDGVLVQANEAFFKLSGHPRGTNVPAFSWLEHVHNDDKASARSLWDTVANGSSVTSELRFMSAPPDANGQAGLRWTSAAVVPVLDDETGKVISISGCLTDISAQKRSQEDAIKRAEALELARVQEQRFRNFATVASCPVMIYNADRQVRQISD